MQKAFSLKSALDLFKVSEMSYKGIHLFEVGWIKFFSSTIISD